MMVYGCYCLLTLFYLLMFMQVLDNGQMVKIEMKYLHEVPADLVGLVEPVQDLEVRVNLLSNALTMSVLLHLGFFYELDC